MKAHGRRRVPSSGSRRIRHHQHSHHRAERLGVDVVFGIPGGAILPAYDPLLDSVKVRHILVRHEQGGAHAADGYARVTGQVGVCMGTSGPGATNLVTGIGTALLDSVPMVAITGNVPSALIGKDAFQEIDINGITLPMTKHNYLVRDANELPRVIAEAFHIARTGRPGPVHIDITKDALQQETNAPHPTDEEVIAGRRPVEEAFAARREAKRLLVVPQRREALERLVLHATNLRIPVVEVEGGTLTSVAGFDGHQGVAIVVSPRRYATLDEILARAIERGEPPFILALDSLEDPQNVGTLLRSAEAAGVHGAFVAGEETLIEWLLQRARTDKLAFATAGAGTTPHLTGEHIFKAIAKLDVTHIPYKGAGPAAVAVDDFPGAMPGRLSSLKTRPFGCKVNS